MKTSPFDIGFRVVGHRAGTRRPIDHAAAFAGYAECDPRAELHRESYLSHFTFGRDFTDYLERERSEKGYNGPCGASWLWMDVDRPDDLEAALRDARRLAGAILDRYRDFDDDDLLIFLSGNKGAHVGIPAAWHPEPSPSFNVVAKRFALELAEQARVAVDGTIYSKTRLFRAPNSRHPKTGLFKRRLSLDELTYLTPAAIVERARHPEVFDIPGGPARCQQAADDWERARRAVEQRAEQRSARPEGEAKLSAFARRFLRDGEMDFDKRAVSTFRAAAELSELYHAHGFEHMVHALLSEAALDSGLTPGETAKQIRDGVAHARRQAEGGAA
jgi:hypothetical protein